MSFLFSFIFRVRVRVKIGLGLGFGFGGKSAGQRTKRIFEALLKITNKMAGSMG